jgi:hypothetical protein
MDEEGYPDGFRLIDPDELDREMDRLEELIEIEVAKISRAKYAIRMSGIRIGKLRKAQRELMDSA